MKSRMNIRILAGMAIIGAALAAHAQAGDRSWQGGHWSRDTRSSHGYGQGRDWNDGRRYDGRRYDGRSPAPYAYRSHRGYGYHGYPGYYRWNRAPYYAPYYAYGPRYDVPYGYSPGYYAPPSWGVWLDVPGLVLQFQLP
ncbi:MAG: hypothetical protein JSR95_06745 [Proteobacteria bacterium]|nr:hypothetical protein [Pseudomonadota bacterium]